MRKSFEAINFEMSNNCNLRCRFCTYHKRNEFSGKKLPLALYEKSLSQLIDNGFLFNAIRLDGNGEALTYGDSIIEAVKIGKKLQKRILIVTNGILLDMERAERLISAGIDHVIISCTGVSPDVYSLFQGSHFADIKQVDAQLQVLIRNVTDFVAMRDRMRKSVSIQMNYILADESQSSFFEYAKTFRAIGVDRIFVTPLQGDPQSPDYISGEELPGYQIRKSIGLIYCDAFYNTLTIYANGDVYPCCGPIIGCEEFAIGNIYETPITNILSSGKFIELEERMYGEIENIPMICNRCKTTFVRSINEI